MPHDLTHNEIIFRVLLQRDEQRAGITYAALEAALPKDIRKRIEPDWRAYIRDEGLEFDSAFQKAVRKHLPGLYYLIMAAEFLFKTPFHTALAHYLLVGHATECPTHFESEEVFALAEELAAEVRRRQAEATKTQSSPAQPFSTPPSKSKPVPGVTAARNRKPTALTPSQSRPIPRELALKHSIEKPPATWRRCAFCRLWFPPGQIVSHVEQHLNPPSRGAGPVPVPTINNRNTTEHRTVLTTKAIYPPEPRKSRQARFNSGLCISCGHVPIPGDFYCYYCAPK